MVACLASNGIACLSSGKPVCQFLSFWASSKFPVCVEMRVSPVLWQLYPRVWATKDLLGWSVIHTLVIFDHFDLCQMKEIGIPSSVFFLKTHLKKDGLFWGLSNLHTERTFQKNLGYSSVLSTRLVTGAPCSFVSSSSAPSSPAVSSSAGMLCLERWGQNSSCQKLETKSCLDALIFGQGETSGGKCACTWRRGELLGD